MFPNGRILFNGAPVSKLLNNLLASLSNNSFHFDFFLHFKQYDNITLCIV